MGKHTGSIDGEVLSRITKKKRGWVFTQTDFLDIGTLAAVRQALSRNSRAGAIRTLARGLYDYPHRHPRLGLMSASTDEIVKALRRRDAFRLQPTGANAANVLGLSDQVPVRTVFLTDGRSRTIRIGKRTILLKKTTPRQMETAGRVSGTIIQALRWLGRRNVDEKTVSILRRQLTARDKKVMLKDARYAPAWVSSVMKQIAE